MKRYTVYTERGAYSNIRAFSKEHAKKVVWKMTLGRERMEGMTVVCTGALAA